MCQLVVKEVKMNRLENGNERTREPRTRKQPNVRLYADTIHCSRDSGMLRARPIVGRMMTVLCTPSVYEELANHSE